MNENEALKAKLAEEPMPGWDGYMTSVEIAREMGWSIRKTVNRLRELKETGDLEVTNVQRVNLGGRLSTVPGYKIKVKDS